MSYVATKATPSAPIFPDVTPDDITLLRRILRSVREGHDVEIKQAPNGKLKVLEVSKKNISVG